MIFDQPILIAGYGSIGRRHLQNLRNLGHKNFVLYRTGKSTLPDDEIKDIPVESNLKRALAYKPLATVITNPTALHIPIALAAAKSGSHLFIEKPISHNLNGVDELKRLIKRNKLVVQVGFQFRFHPGIQKIKSLLEKNRLGRVVSVQAHWGEYLPDWHPYEDYKKGYAARKDLGGGVLLTLCHPFDYLRYLFGEVSGVSAQINNSKTLGINAEESADVILKFKSGVIGNVSVNYIERPSDHYVNVVAERGKIHWNNSKPKGFDRNKMFISEMRNFLFSIEGKDNPKCSLDDGIKALSVVLAAKESARKGGLIQL